MSDGPIGAGGAVVSPPDGTGTLPTASPKLYFAHLPPDLAPVVVAAADSVDVVQKTIVVPFDGDYWVIGTVSFVGQGIDFATCEADLVLDDTTALESAVGTSVFVTQPNPFSYFDSVAVQAAVRLTAGAHTLSIQCTAGAGSGINVEFASIAIQPFVSIDAVPP